MSTVRQSRLDPPAQGVSGKRLAGSFTDQIPIGQLTAKPFKCSSGKARHTATRGKQGSETR